MLSLPKHFIEGSKSINANQIYSKRQNKENYNSQGSNHWWQDLLPYM